MPTRGGYIQWTFEKMIEEEEALHGPPPIAVYRNGSGRANLTIGQMARTASFQRDEKKILREQEMARKRARWKRIWITASWIIFLIVVGLTIAGLRLAYLHLKQNPRQQIITSRLMQY